LSGNPKTDYVCESVEPTIRLHTDMTIVILKDNYLSTLFYRAEPEMS